MRECLPEDLTFLDNYQQNAWEQIVWDSPERITIQGLQPEAYMLKGLQEEIVELIEPDRDEPDYRRLGAIIMHKDNEALQPGLVTPSAVTRHLKEFGDVSWYLANYLDCFNIPFERTAPVGILSWQLDAASKTRGTEDEHLELQSVLPWVYLFGSSAQLSSAANEMVRTVQGHVVRKPRDERIRDEQELLVAAGRFVVSMMHVLSTRFNITYEQVLMINKDKIEKRIKEGTVFDKPLGEDR